MRRYFYRDKTYIYLGFDYDPRYVSFCKEHHGKYNDVNKEWYIPFELYNMNIINEFLKENNFTNKIIPTERTIPRYLPDILTDKKSLGQIIKYLNFSRTVREYQIDVVEYMLNHGNCLNGSDVGTGKTGESVVLIEILDAFPCLVICPATVKAGWKKEWALWKERLVSIIDSKKKPDFSAEVIIINYDLLSKYEKEIKKIKWKSCIVDEIHFCKNTKAIRSKLTKKLTKKIPQIFGLSGTSIISRPNELINILQIIRRFDIFPDTLYYQKRYCNAKKTEYGWDTSSAVNVMELNAIINEYCYIRKEKREVLVELPPLVKQIIEIDITNKKEYNSAKEDLFSYLSEIDLEKAEKSLNAPHLVMLSTLKQLSIQGKLKQLETFISEWRESNQDENLLVLGIYKTPLNTLHEHFPESLLITGDIKLQEKMEIIEKFKKSKGQVLFANGKTIGTGVDGLQESCSNMVIIEQPDTPGEEDQWFGRLERSGQKYSINIYYLLCKETIDVDRYEALQYKRKITDQVNRGVIASDKGVDWIVLQRYLQQINSQV